MRIEIDIDGNLTEHEDAPIIEQTELELTAQKVQETIVFLIATNHKDFPRYIPKDDEDMEALYAKRAEALLFIRENK